MGQGSSLLMSCGIQGELENHEHECIHDKAPKVGPDDLVICVQGLTGHYFTIVVPKSGVVHDLKQAIYFRTGIRSNDQRLSYGGKPLKEDLKPLSQTGIHMMSTVNLVVDTLGAA
jgi:hypothetical protein